MIHQRIAIASIAVCFLILSPNVMAEVKQTNAEDQRPNVVLIMADDM